MIFAYNKQHVGDVLLIVVADDKGQENTIECKGKITKITTTKSNEVVAWNIFDASELLGPIQGKGQVKLSQEQIIKLNKELKKNGFLETIEEDVEPKLVVGFVKSCKKHPDSDHLSITQTEVDKGEILEIVCGAPNVRAGQKVVVAKPGAMMPDGLIIWPGKLRGIESFGMLCSANELGVPNASRKKGILELPVDASIGAPFILGSS